MRFATKDLGRLPYAEATALQTTLLEKVVEGESHSTLLLVEHDPVLTLGAAHEAENLLHSPDAYQNLGIEVHKTDRGGDVTYHGPGQLVAYPIFDLKQTEKDLHKWLRGIEEAIILTLSDFGLEARRFPPHTGVWIGDRKIAAIGIKVRKWVSMHGLAINCDLDLAPFGLIVPCGIKGYGVTSLTREVGRRVGIEEVKPRLVDAFEEIFG
jgi:lipoyl(octanoyl) transferase